MVRRVTWEIDVDSDSDLDAVLQARAIMMDESSIATVFGVTDENGEEVTVDLEDLNDGEAALYAIFEEARKLGIHTIDTKTGAVIFTP